MSYPYDGAFENQSYGGYYNGKYLNEIWGYSTKGIAQTDEEMANWQAKNKRISQLLVFGASVPKTDPNTGAGPIISFVVRENQSKVPVKRLLNADQSKPKSQVNIRYDGSSRFLSNKRWAWFPSASLGWNIAREEFFGNLGNSISTFKLRGSWGESGLNMVYFLPSNYSLVPTTHPGYNVHSSIRPILSHCDYRNYEYNPYKCS